MPIEEGIPEEKSATRLVQFVAHKAPANARAIHEGTTIRRGRGRERGREGQRGRQGRAKSTREGEGKGKGGGQP